MSRMPTEGRRGGGWPPFGITTILSASTCLFVGFHLAMALGREDVDAYESPLILSVARQLVAGPWGLYGPYGGSNPLVLIHAPLYYRAAALLAWPMAHAGLHPAEAARVAGRTLSGLSLIATMAAAYRLGRLGELPRPAGWWSALLVAASPVLAGIPFAVRPDMTGIALETWGIALALGSLERSRRLGWASVLFGLACCVKQHLVIGWIVSAVLWSWWRSGTFAVARLVLPGVAVAGSIYGAEWVVTGGRVWEAAFVAASHVGRVHPGDWLHVATVLAAMVGKGAGPAAMVVAGAAVKRTAGLAAVVASMLVVAIAMLSVAQLVLSGSWVTLALPAVAMAGLSIGLVGCVATVGPSVAGRRLDAALGIYAGCELVMLAALCRSSSGGWINYGIPAMIDASVLAARSLAGASGAMPRVRWAIPVTAAVAVLASVLMDAKVEATRRRAEHAELARVFAATRLPPSAFFFDGRPGLNRSTGRLEFAFDGWLYPVFESLKLAEPRGRWLGPRLGPSAGVRAVVRESDAPRVDGVEEPLPELGFVRAGRSGAFRVWVLAGPVPGRP